MDAAHAVQWSFILICLAVTLIGVALLPSRPAIGVVVAGALATIFAAIAAFA